MDGSSEDTRLVAEDVLAAIGVGVIVVDADGYIVLVNRKSSELLGRTEDQLVGRPVDEAIHAHRQLDRAPGSPCDLATAITGHEPCIAENDVFLRYDGSLLPVSWTVGPMAATPNAPAVLSFVDVAEREISSVADAASREQERADLWSAQQSVSDLGWIAELTRVMSSTMDERESLLRLARLLTPRLADIAIVDMIDDEGRWHRLGGSVAPGIELDLPLLLARSDVQHDETDVATRRTATGQTVTRLDQVHMADPTVLSAPSRRLLAEIGAQSLLITPLAARSRTVGVAGLVRLSPDAYSDTDMLLAADIGRRAGLVLDNARLYSSQQRTAEDLQRALLPEVRDIGPLRVAARYLPAADRFRVGGDWYDTFACPEASDTYVLVIGDVAGHDLQAATTMAAVRNLIRGVAVTVGGGPANVLAAVDRAMTTLGITGTATVTIVRAQRQVNGWTLTWANAGHPPALVVTDEYPAFLDSRPDPLLGTHSNPPRHDHTRAVPSGSRLALYTDGLIERRDEPLDRGLQRLRQAALTSSLDVDTLLESVLAHTRRSRDDDTAVLVARFD